MPARPHVGQTGRQEYLAGLLITSRTPGGRDEYGAYLAKTGGEVGVTTGRARRCGWFDAVIARYATRVNGITDYFLTKLDVLSSLETVPVCVGYTVDGTRVYTANAVRDDFQRCGPVLCACGGARRVRTSGASEKAPSERRSWASTLASQKPSHADGHTDGARRRHAKHGQD